MADYTETAEVQAARERLAVATASPGGRHAPSQFLQDEADRATLADAYPALKAAYDELRAERQRFEDPTPVDEAWLESIGLADDSCFRDSKRFSVTDEVAIWARACAGPRRWYWELRSGRKVIYEPTRGQVRKLLSALGIELKEPT